MVGLIVEEKGLKKSKGCAPDLLLLLESGEIIICEIKCLVSQPIDNTSYRRAISLASRQIESCINIINCKDICNRGLIIIVYIYYNENKIVYDTRVSIVNY
jgi:hypothetical protein